MQKADNFKDMFNTEKSRDQMMPLDLKNCQPKTQKSTSDDTPAVPDFRLRTEAHSQMKKSREKKFGRHR